MSICGRSKSCGFSDANWIFSVPMVHEDSQNHNNDDILFNDLVNIREWKLKSTKMNGSNDSEPFTPAHGFRTLDIKKKQRELLEIGCEHLKHLLEDLDADKDPCSLQLNLRIEEICRNVKLAKVCSAHEKMEYELLLWHQNNESQCDQMSGYPGMPDMKQYGCTSESNNSFLGAGVGGGRSQRSMTIMNTNNLFKCECPILNSLDEWNFDIFTLEHQSNGEPLTRILDYLYEKHQFGEYLGTEKRMWTNFVRRIEMDYEDIKIVPYHNRLHAGQTVAATYWFLNSEFFSSTTIEDMVAVLIAAAIHDVGHMGRTNHFLITTSNDLAIEYNDEAVLENFHLAHAFRLLKKRQYDIFANLTPDQKCDIRAKIISHVLGTDMSRHNAKCEMLSDNRGNKHLQCDELYSAIVHASDISAPALSWDISREFADRITEEFHMEGDELKLLGLKSSELFDREKFTNAASSQIAFISFVVEPFLELMSFWVEELRFPLSILQKNKECWNYMQTRNTIGDVEFRSSSSYDQIDKELVQNTQQNRKKSLDKHTHKSPNFKKAVGIKKNARFASPPPTINSPDKPEFITFQNMYDDDDLDNMRSFSEASMGRFNIQKIETLIDLHTDEDEEEERKPIRRPIKRRGRSKGISEKCVSSSSDESDDT